MRLLAVALLASSLAAAATASAGRRLPTLVGIVGPTFTIKMSAKTVEAGTYLVTIKDLSAFHNFHLVGPGIDKWTGVQKQGTFHWQLTLRKGTYHYTCDPHSTTMKGTLKVS